MTAPRLAARGIRKRYPGVQALDGVTLELHAGEVHAVVGENGAGKSTLMKVLSGATLPDAGELALDGVPVRIATPHAAHALGIRMIHQELSLVPALTVAENIVLGAEPSRRGIIDRRRMREHATRVLDQLAQRLPLDVPVARLSLAARQMTEIAKAMSQRARVLIMDEPTSILAEQDVAALGALIARLRGEGMAIVFISHRLDEVSRFAQRVTVLRDGRTVHAAPVSELSRGELVRHMVGRELAAGYPPRAGAIGVELLRVEGLSSGPVQDASVAVHRGEIVALVGLVGAGRTELARAIYGAAPRTHGALMLDGQPFAPRSPRAAIAAGVGLLPEDRKAQGLILHEAVRFNASLAALDTMMRAGVVQRTVERRRVREWLESLRVRTPSIEQPARALSGGNQQKVVLARWMLANARLLIFDEPTRGVDVSAKAEIYALMRSLTARGAGVLMISSELPEALGMADRVVVMREGRVAATLDAADATAERVGELMMPAGVAA